MRRWSEGRWAGLDALREQDLEMFNDEESLGVNGHASLSPSCFKGISMPIPHQIPQRRHCLGFELQDEWSCHPCPAVQTTNGNVRHSNMGEALVATSKNGPTSSTHAAGVPIAIKSNSGMTPPSGPFGCLLPYI
jgi:hypothetical protein